MDQSNHDKGITSVKVHHQPGGQSSFSLAHDNGTVDDRFASSGKVGSAPAVVPQGAPGFKTVEEQKQELPDAGPGSFTSVKYSGNPPGGKSSGPLW
jgi:hypothetical protein